MKNKVLFGGALGLMVLLVFGGLWASNTGFKLNKGLEAQGTNSSRSGQQTIALPFNQQTDLVNALDLLGDIGVNAELVAEWNTATDAFSSYDGTPGGGVNFTLTPGLGYLVKVSTDTPYIIVGSHAPTMPIDFAFTGTRSGQNLFSYPYHSVSNTAEDLLNEIETFAGGNFVEFVARYDTTTDGFASYDGSSSSGPNFNLVPGRAYLIKVTTDITGYIPSHF